MPEDNTAADHGGQAAAGALARGMSLLEAFAAGDCWLGNAELARRTGLPKATVSRLSATLVTLGYLRQNSKGQFTPGLQLLALASMALGGLPLRRLVRPWLTQLADQLDGSVSIATLQQDRITLIDEVQGAKPDPLLAAQGLRPSVTASAVGRALLSLLEASPRQTLLARQAAGASSLDLDWQARTLQAVADCGQKGYCIKTHGSDPAKTTIGLPVMVLPNGLPLALNCSTPTHALAQDASRRLQLALSTTANIRTVLVDALR